MRDMDTPKITEAGLRGRLSHFYDPFDIDLWLDRPHPLLAGKSARQLIDDGRIDEVDRILAQLEDGAFI